MPLLAFDAVVWRCTRMKRAVTAILAVMAAVQFYSASLENQTFDEGVHIAAGMSYWATGDYRANIEHPPLAKLLFALPLMAAGLEFDANNPHWEQPDQTALGRDLLYSSHMHADTILALARSVTIGFTLALGAAIAWWTRQRFGDCAALLAVAVFALDPTFLAHGRYATTDVPVACLSFLSVIAWVEWLDRGGRPMLLAAAVLFGLAAATKFSALYAVPVHAGLGLAAVVSRLRGRAEVCGGIVAVAAAGILICSAVYGWGGLTARGPDNFPPGHPYLTGLETLAQHNRDGHPRYLLGSIGKEGRWQYFPISFAVKTPLGTLLLLAAALVSLLARRPQGLVWAALLAYPACYFGLSMVSNINIGVRHLLPVYPFLFVLIGAAAHRWRRPAMAAVLAIGIENAAVFPHYLAFFNLAAGGMEAGPRWLLDSNIDWGQDVKKLKAYTDRQRIDTIGVALFTNADPAYYGLRATELPVLPEELRMMNGWAAVSVTSIFDVYNQQPRYGWLRKIQPVARIGGSIYVYDLRHETLPLDRRGPLRRGPA